MARTKISDPVGFGVIGAGLWGSSHAEVFYEHPYSRLVAVCDLNEQKARTLADPYDAEAYSNLDDFLARDDIQAVGIATPDFLHRDPAVAAAKAGKHILLEKPLATTREDAEEIREVIDKTGVRCMVDFHARWNPAFCAAKQSIDRGELGRIVSGYLRLNDVISVPLEMLAWAEKSSILWFLGSHTVDSLRWFFNDEVARVYSVSRDGVLKKMGVDAPDTYQTILEFEGGPIATIENNWILPNTQPNVNDIKVNILGSEGMLDLDLTNHGVVKRFLKDKYDQPDVFVKPEIHGSHEGFAYASIRDFVQRIVTGEDFVVGVSDGEKVTKVVLAIMESARIGEPVSVRY